MSTAEKSEIVSEETYLALEQAGTERHELVGGVMYAMAGETTDHNEIVQRLLVRILERLRGGPCRAFVGAVKLRLDVASTFYYPDLMVTCDPRDTDKRFIRFPKLLIEVLSPGTEAVDRREKLFAYLQVSSLEEYVLVSSFSREVVIFRQADGWRPVRLPAGAGELELTSLGVRMQLEEIFGGLIPAEPPITHR
jgi:Uma2 family endonuclease